MLIALAKIDLQDEEVAYAWVEARLWPEGPRCAHCGEKGASAKWTARQPAMPRRVLTLPQTVHCQGLAPSSNNSHVPMHIWLQAFDSIAGIKKGISSNQLHRTLGVTLKTAWFVGHRIREAMRTGSLAAPIGGEGNIVSRRNVHRQKEGQSEEARRLPQASGSEPGRAWRRSR